MCKQEIGEITPRFLCKVAIPLQKRVISGKFIETTTYAIIQFSIGILLTVPVAVLERTPVRRLYAGIFRRFGQQEPTPLPAT